MATTIRFQLRGDSAENWESKNPILLKNEPGYDITNRRLKLGDGVHVWKELEYIAPDMINDLITGGIDKALSAEQGKVLSELIDTKTKEVKDSITTVDIIDGLNSDRTDAALSANQGRELKALVDAKADSTTINSQIMTINTQVNKKLDADRVTHETWVFTLEDESTVNKEVVLWNS